MKIVWYHIPTDTIFQNGHLEVMFLNLMSFDRWNEFELLGEL